jgi:hypothetical protein
VGRWGLWSRDCLFVVLWYGNQSNMHVGNLRTCCFHYRIIISFHNRYIKDRTSMILYCEKKWRSKDKILNLKLVIEFQIGVDK